MHATTQMHNFRATVDILQPFKLVHIRFSDLDGVQGSCSWLHFMAYRHAFAATKTSA
jgi:hypothetical protein